MIDSVEDAIDHADLATSGEHTWKEHNAPLERNEVRMRSRREVEVLVREAVDAELFEVHYQPLLHGKTKTCVGFEALLRLKGRDGVWIRPTAFIPVAESTGRDIKNWRKLVTDEATSTAALWPDPMFVSVNLSVRQFGAEDLLGIVEAALDQSGLDPGRLELEVTESLVDGEYRSRGPAVVRSQAAGGIHCHGRLWHRLFQSGVPMAVRL